MSLSRRFAFALLALIAVALLAVGVILRIDPQLIFSGVVAVSTVCYVLLTWRLVEEQRTLRRAETEPQVSVYAEISPRAFTIFDLVIANIGRGPAYELKLSIVGEDWLIQQREKLSDTGPFKHGIAYLAPGQALRFFVGTGPEIYQAGRNSFSVSGDVPRCSAAAEGGGVSSQLPPLLGLDHRRGGPGFTRGKVS